MGEPELELSPKYGLNPVIPACFFCGNDRDEVVLLGRIRKEGDPDSDVEAPMHATLDYEPCDECKSKFEQGILLVEASATPCHENQRPIAEGTYPTGRHMVVTEDGMRKIVSDAETLAAVLEKRTCFMEPDAFDMVIAMADAAG